MLVIFSDYFAENREKLFVAGEPQEIFPRIGEFHLIDQETATALSGQLSVSFKDREKISFS